METTTAKWLDIARIDIKNHGEGNDVRVKVLEGKNCQIMQPKWFAEDGIGYVLETEDKHIVLNLECKGKGALMIRLMGVDRRSSMGERLPLWVDYNRLSINGELIFWEVKSQWHDKNYIYTKQVANEEILRVEISWSQHGYKGEELAQLLSLWNVEKTIC